MKENNDFKVGDRVECCVDHPFIPYGSKGTVLVVDDGVLGVEWDDITCGHDLAPSAVNCKEGHGWWINTLSVKQETKKTYSFKVGDRVECIKADSVVSEGSKGYVRFVANYIIGVEFDKKLKEGYGHELAWCAEVGDTGISCKEGHGRWMLPEGLKVIAMEEEETKEALFKVGDRVECCVDHIHVPYGAKGTVLTVDDIAKSVGVEWDTFDKGHTFGGGVECKEGHGWWLSAQYLKHLTEEHSNPHYETNLQPIEFMQANMTPEEFVGFLKGNIIKYTARCGKKDAVDKEVAKIIEYAKWLAKAYKGETINPRES